MPYCSRWLRSVDYNLVQPVSNVQRGVLLNRVIVLRFLPVAREAVSCVNKLESMVHGLGVS
jgi:hypothetical protein